MVARSLDGLVCASLVKSGLAERVSLLKDRGVFPGLGTIVVGDDVASRLYVAGKHRDCAEVGIRSLRAEFACDVSQGELEDKIVEFNEDDSCTGYIVQLPLPAHLDVERILGLVDPGKDADGLHPVNLGRLVLGVGGGVGGFPVPCTPVGILELLRFYGVGLAGSHVVVVGRGVTVGRSLGLLLSGREVNATVTLAHTGTRDLGRVLGGADVVVVAAGVPGLVVGGMVRSGVVVVDVGVSRSDVGKVCGDVDVSVWGVASWVSPNPGGVGPMTRAMLLKNVVDLAS